MALKKIMLFSCFVTLLFWNNNINVVEGVIGVNWGRQSAQRLVPAQVVDLMLQNGVKETRIYNGNIDVLQAFSGSGIGVTLSIVNIKFFMDNSPSPQIGSRRFVQQKIVAFPDVNIRRIYYGDVAGWVWANSSTSTGKPSLSYVLEHMKYMHDALTDFGYAKKVKVTIPQPFEILKVKHLKSPSDAEFRDDVKEDIVKLLGYLKANDAPFVLESIPLAFINENNIDISFAFCDNKSTHVVVDPKNGLVYTNVLEFMYDSFVWAMKKAGFMGVKILVSQVAWPTDGDKGASLENAERYYKSLLPYVISNKGTPMRPGIPIDVNILSFVDENKAVTYLPYMRHCGIYKGNGEPKFKIDLTGQGRDIFPPKAKGISRMPKRWCVYNGVNKNRTYLLEKFNKACNKSDCSSLARGGSCGNLDFAGNISYALNMFFQFNFQDEKSCEYEGLGKIVTVNPSNGTCNFNVDVVKGVQKQMGQSQLLKVPQGAIILFLLLTLLALF